MDALRSVAPSGSPLSVGSPLVWFIFVACVLLQLPLLMDICSQLFGVNRMVHNASHFSIVSGLFNKKMQSLPLIYVIFAFNVLK